MLVTTLAAPCAIVKRTITPDGVAESINTGKKIIDWNYNGQRNGSIDVKTTSRIWASLGRDRLARYHPHLVSADGHGDKHSRRFILDSMFIYERTAGSLGRRSTLP
ncbi:hypothetical protein LMH87_006642 [Akanthomyces muscarius]|uniref:Uncharacterized protein n=1 Tax=Akanthomyces muscarius TaxID=2231603 RepID=A0A9W8UQI3_AKAMU|nr:hypothetical protein LMH87_006642 [Akanthomyces muscarius]KAJ4164992.1 hypothetical protein LMH87_006642 [Akanthomyces muscarius]